jgi:hypothetical protein
VPEVKMLIIGSLHLTNILMTKEFLDLLEEDEEEIVKQNVKNLMMNII